MAKKAESIYYQVQFQTPLLSEWTPVKAIEPIAGQLAIEIAPTERLTLSQALSRCTDLTRKFPMFSFRVIQQLDS